MSDTLSLICEKKRAHIITSKIARPLSETETAAKGASTPRGFFKALKSAADADEYGLIAEIKKASPSKGLIRTDFNPSAIAQAYEQGGATCISVLTDFPYFQGVDADLTAARSTVTLPVIRKDFMIDPYQVPEARALGADCILLILAALDDLLAAEIESCAMDDWGMDVLLEVHCIEELERAMNLQSPLLGINNRNLKTLETDTETTRELAPLVVDPERLVISESGLYTHKDLISMYDAGARGFLIGESLMRQQDVEMATRALLNGGRTTGSTK